MTSFPPYCLQPLPHPSRPNACKAIMAAPDGFWVEIHEETRTVEQNRLLWPILTLWAKKIQMVVNGNPIFVAKEAWKVAHLADFRREHGDSGLYALTPGGILVPLGFETHTMGKHEFADFLTFILAETGERGMELPPRCAEECQGYIQKYSREVAA